MKNRKLKIPNIKSPKLGKYAPHIFVGTLLMLGLVILSFGYYAFKRPADESVVSKAKGELQEINIALDKEEVSKLFDAKYSTSNIKEPTFPTKNPFLSF